MKQSENSVLRNCKLIKSSDARLRIKSTNVDYTDIKERQLVSAELRQLFETHPKSQGFSLPQIGVNRRAIICRVKKVSRIMLNPIIQMRVGNWSSNEGCESLIGRYIVKRPIFIFVTYYDEQGVLQSKWFNRRWSRIIEHEVDHLDGILISEKGKRWRVTAYDKTSSNCIS